MKSSLSAINFCRRLSQLWGNCVRFPPLLLLLLCLLPMNAFGEEGEAEVTIEKIKAAWTSRQSALEDVAFKIEWTDKKIRALPAHLRDLGKDGAPNEQAPRELHADSSIVMSKGKMRFQSSTLDLKLSTKRYEPVTITIVWQGEVGKSFWDHNSLKDNSGRISKDLKRLVDQSVRAPFLAMRPLDPAYGHIDLTNYEVAKLHLIVDDHKCAILRRKDRGTLETELYVDPENEFLIRRVIGRSNDFIDRQIDIEYQKIEKSGWVPSSWRLVIFNPESKDLRFQLTAIVKNVSLADGVTDSTFDIEFPRGTLVRDLSEVGKLPK